jgi:hypothetical protein
MLNECDLTFECLICDRQWLEHCQIECWLFRSLHLTFKSHLTSDNIHMSFDIGQNSQVIRHRTTFAHHSTLGNIYTSFDTGQHMTCKCCPMSNAVQMTCECCLMSNDVWMLSDVQWRANLVRCRLTCECSPLSNDVWMLPNVEYYFLIIHQSSTIHRSVKLVTLAIPSTKDWNIIISKLNRPMTKLQHR